MKKITFLVLTFIFTSALSNAQIQLWAMNTRGGAASDGSIFKCTPQSSSSTSVTEFNGTNGVAPFGSLIQASDGNLYGMTRDGGHTSNGSIFKCSTSGTITTIAEFNGTNGATPYGDLMQGADGNFYGMTTFGGAFGYGVIFQCTPAGLITSLVDFEGSNGMYPNGNLIQGKDGNLYGLATYGGTTSGDSGTIFRCTTSGTLTVLDTFKSYNGGNPNGSLIQATDGNFYGMTMYGGQYDSGTIFKCTPEGILTTLYSFSTASGCFPYGSLVQGPDGNLYGMTETGGSFNYGTIFKCTTAGTLTTLVTFNDTNGANPLGSIMLASDSNLYGFTSGGGAGAGTIFQCSTAGKLTTVSNLVGYIYACDPVRQYGTLTEVNPTLGINNIESNSNMNLYPDPAHDILNLSFDIQGASGTLVTIIDISGKELITTTEAITNGKTISIDISSLSEGMYFAKVATDKNSQVFKFIKN